MTPEQAELFPDICRVAMCPHGIPENENERCVDCMESLEEIVMREYVKASQIGGAMRRSSCKSRFEAHGKDRIVSLGFRW